MTVRQIAADYARCGEVLRRYGGADRPGIKFGHLEPLERFAQRRGIECKTLLRELAAATEVETAPDSSLERNVHRPFIVLALADALSMCPAPGTFSCTMPPFTCQLLGVVAVILVFQAKDQAEMARAALPNWPGPPAPLTS